MPSEPSSPFSPAGSRAPGRRLRPDDAQAGSTRVVWTLGVGAFGLAFSLTTTAAYLPPLLGQFTTSATLIALVLAAEGLFAITLPLVIGPWSDSFHTPLGLYPDLLPERMYGRAQNAQHLMRGLALATALIGGGALFQAWEAFPFLVAAVVVVAACGTPVLFVLEDGGHGRVFEGVRA